MDIDESVAALEDKEGFFGFKITVFDKSGNEHKVRFEDDGSALEDKIRTIMFFTGFQWEF